MEQWKKVHQGVSSLMNWVHFYRIWKAGCLTTTYLVKRWQYGKKASGQCSAGKPWVLPFMWILFWRAPPTKNIVPEQVEPFIKKCSATLKKWFRNSLRNRTTSSGCWLGFQKSPDLNLMQHLVCAGQTCLIYGDPTSQFIGRQRICCYNFGVRYHSTHVDFLSLRSCRFQALMG